MTRRTRFTLAIAALMMGLAYVAPIWHIGLEAPQYPEGIGMYIWIDTIIGEKPNDLNSINGLNHYIGMKAIVPDAIAELRLMPWLVGSMMALGLAAAARGRRVWLYAWTAIFVLGALGGLVDFWYWGYDYGHDLDPTAAIKIPGFSYQPPILGSKKLLNFTAHSWPGLGGWAIVIGLMVGLLLSVLEWRRARTARVRSTLINSARAATIALLAVLTVAAPSACARPGPGVIHYDVDACDHCRMTIAEPAFAAQLVTQTGRVLRFDDPACLAAFVSAGNIPAAEIHSLWLNDHANPETRVRADDAVFLVSDRIRAPMNGGAAAFAEPASANALATVVGGRRVRWADLLQKARS